MDCLKDIAGHSFWVCYRTEQNIKWKSLSSEEYYYVFQLELIFNMIFMSI